MKGSSVNDRSNPPIRLWLSVVLLFSMASGPAFAREEGSPQSRVDVLNDVFLDRLYFLMKKNGGVAGGETCYTTPGPEIVRTDRRIRWCSRKYCLTLHADRTPAEEEFMTGRASTVRVQACRFRTRSGLECMVKNNEKGERARNVRCVDERGRKFEADDAGGLVPVRPVSPPDDETPTASECARLRLDYIQREAACRQMSEPQDRERCEASLGPEPPVCL